MSGASGRGAEGIATPSAPAQTANTPRGGYQREFWLVFAASAALSLAANLFVFFPVFVVRLGGGAATIGAIAGVGSFAALCVRPGVGALIDWRGRRWTALWSVVLEAAAVALYVPVHSLGWPIYAVRLLHGALDGTARVALFAMVFEILPQGRRGEGMALFSLCGIGPAAFGPLLGEALLKQFGFALFFYAAGALCLGAAAAVTMLKDDRPPVHAAQASGADERVGYRALLLDPALRPLWIVALAFSIAISPRNNFVAPFAYQRGIAHVGWYFAVYSAIAVAVRLLGGRLMDRVGIERIVTPSLGLLAVGIALLGLTGRSGALLGAAVLGGLGHSYTYPALSALVIAHTPPEAFGRSSTIYTSLFDFAAMVAPYLLGLIAAQWGYGPMFVIAGLVGALGAVYYAGVVVKAA